MMFCEYLWCKSDELSRAQIELNSLSIFNFAQRAKPQSWVLCVSRHHRSRVQSFSPYSDTLWYASCRKGDEEFTCKIRKSAWSIGTTVIDIQIKALLAFEFHVTINAVCVLSLRWRTEERKVRTRTVVLQICGMEEQSRSERLECHKTSTRGHIRSVVRSAHWLRTAVLWPANVRNCNFTQS